MKFSSDELMPFSEVRTGMSHFLADVQGGKEIVITRHGKPVAALVAATQLYRYRELDRLMGALAMALRLQAETGKPDQAPSLMALVQQAEQLLIKPVDSTS